MELGLNSLVLVLEADVLERSCLILVSVLVGSKSCCGIDSSILSRWSLT